MLVCTAVSSKRDRIESLFQKPSLVSGLSFVKTDSNCFDRRSTKSLFVLYSCFQRRNCIVNLEESEKGKCALSDFVCFGTFVYFCWGNFYTFTKSAWPLLV